jgi:hypothetical protein
MGKVEELAKKRVMGSSGCAQDGGIDGSLSRSSSIGMVGENITLGRICDGDGAATVSLILIRKSEDFIN